MQAERRAFRRADFVRAVKAAQAAGLTVTRTEVGPDGKITLFHDGAATEPLSPFDAWKAKRDASQP